MVNPEAAPVFVGTDEEGVLTVLGNEGMWDGRPILITLSPPWTNIIVGDQVMATFPSYRHACDAYDAATTCVELCDVEAVIAFASQNAWEEVDSGDAVYISHFTEAYKHANHYVGMTERPLKERIAEHRNGNPGQGLMAAVKASGIDFVIADVLHGGREIETWLKYVHKHTARQCPLCKESSRE